MLPILINSIISSAVAPAAAANQGVSPLAQMHDILLPNMVSSMPIAPGYWLLLVLAVLILSWIMSKIIKQRRYHAPRKTALKILQSMDSNADNFASEVNSLLKRTAMTYLPRQSLAHLNGQPWFNWLDQRLPPTKQQLIGTLLVKRHQAKGLTLDDNQQLLMLASLWLANKSPFEPVSNQDTDKQDQQEAAC
ncbi:DUF4381 domain-containing protein [Shewanella sp. OMA3-2]|uniref:DUF4381 domain-containing protein n=1 Tax=Shewanella sp. OMA3-2 TaxID=2908650 RepID=UPI001F206F50|nr:DUF4381 domain-containing protein [Shewanella sp. OMA3-2]UJF23184.1 DUF4381 domain-containing protein [Shewanella sp. OMA3-2]